MTYEQLKKISKKMHSEEKKYPGAAGFFCAKHEIPMAVDTDGRLHCADCEIERIERNRAAFARDEAV
jgi:hypothetical protein